MEPQEGSSWPFCFETKHAIVQESSRWYPGFIVGLCSHLPRGDVIQTPSENHALPCVAPGLKRQDRQRMEGGTEAQKGQVSCPRPNSRSVAELGMEPRFPDS